jgi:hypothetical protein
MTPVELIANSPTPGSIVQISTQTGNGGSLSSTATTMNTSGAPTPAVLQGSGQFRILWGDGLGEIALVTAGQSGSAWTVTRGVEGTTAIAHADGTAIYHDLTAGAFQALKNSMMFGDGSDGAATLDGTTAVGWATLAAGVYTMNRDCWCTTLTINSGVTLLTNGWILFVAGTFTNNGTIGSGGGNGGATGTGGAAGNGTLTGRLGGGLAGGAGNTAVGTAGSAAAGLGGNSGAGGTGSAGAGGGAGPGQGASLNLVRSRYLQPYAVLSGVINGGNVAYAIRSAASGGGGGGDGTNHGGGGGAGGPLIPIFAYTFVNNGTIICSGGNGGTPTTGNCGGGGGGSGGVALVYTLTPATMGTITLTAGSGGSGVGTGTAGGSGSVGYSLNSILA